MVCKDTIKLVELGANNNRISETEQYERKKFYANVQKLRTNQDFL